jgi:anaerobic nitric oxide reductase transcription regulator
MCWARDVEPRPCVNRSPSSDRARCYRSDDVLEPLLEVALDLSADVAAGDRYQRLVSVARRTIPCDAIALLRVDGPALVPLAVDGLRGEALARRFAPAEHPRLARILASRGPVRFVDASVPDPFDGLFAAHDLTARAHACMGCAIAVEGEVIGVLTFDALSPAAFDDISDETVALLAAFASAAMRTAVLIDAVEHAASRSRQRARALVEEARDRGATELLGVSPAMVRLRQDIELLAGTDLAALVSGESGVGKELVVHAIHRRSARRDQPLVHVNCAALPESLAESELFGHVRGSFTGAVDHRAGKFEVADGGTLFLDEIGELPPAVQPKLLRVLQSGELQRVGSDRTSRVDVRVLAATNRDLAEEVRAGRFRIDLFHRLQVFPLAIPPLRHRREDIPLLSGYFLDVAGARLGLDELRLSPAARAALRDHDWPGNVRELEHTIIRAALRASEGRLRARIVIDRAHLGLDEPDLNAVLGGAAPPSPRLREAVDDFTARLIASTVATCGGNWAEAARRLGVHRGNLHRLATRLGVRSARR